MPAARPTVREVAQRAGVSSATVSYVFNGRANRPSVPDATRQRVLQAAAEVGYEPNHAARSLRRQRSEVVCLVRTAVGGPWVEVLTEQLYEMAAARDHSVITLVVESPERAEHALRVLRRRYADGVIFTPTFFRFPQQELSSLADRGVQLVVFDEETEPRGFDVVRVNAARACAEAVRYLIGRGHRRIAYLGHREDLDDHARSDRYAGYSEAMLGGGARIDERLVVEGADSREEAYLAARRLVSLRDRPTAVFCASDRSALAMMWAVRDMGLAVPDDLAVIGVGNLPEGRVMKPHLTTVGTDSLDFGDVVDRLFHRLSSGDQVPGDVMHRDWRLIVRESA